MKRPYWMPCLAVLLAFSGVAAAAEPEAVDSRTAYRMVLDDPAHTHIVDVRTRPEYEFVGHPDLPNGVPNIPIRFYPDARLNSNFIRDVQRRFSKDEVIITMCRSGKRARLAARQLLAHGFSHVYYMSDSFEGPRDAQGHHTLGGWKVNGLPYTYRLDPDLVYRPSLQGQERQGAARPQSAHPAGQGR